MHLYDTVWYQSKSDFCRRHPQHQRVAVALKRAFGLKAILLEELIAEPTAAMARSQQNKRIVLQAGKIHRLAEAIQTVFPTEHTLAADQLKFLPAQHHDVDKLIGLQ